MKARKVTILCLLLMVVFISGCGAKTPNSGQWAGQSEGMYLSGQGRYIGVIISFEVSPESQKIQKLIIEVAGQVQESYLISEDIKIAKNGTFTFSEDDEVNEYELEGEFLDETSAKINVSVRILNGQDIHLSEGVVNMVWLETE